MYPLPYISRFKYIETVVAPSFFAVFKLFTIAGGMFCGIPDIYW